ncbi:hypothetical protein PUN28_012559 [Cardiocondyla obscurior]|uniref:Uncharacterized protein n=1 Tax=Cardiocondyla obscurior TaxID=286306 RepID=A0AAW2FC08_9HYME
MSDDAPRSLSNDKKLVEKSVDEDSHSRPREGLNANAAKGEDALASADNVESDCFSTASGIDDGEAEAEDRDDNKSRTNEGISTIDKETQHKSKEDESHATCSGNVNPLLERTFPAKEEPEEPEDNLKRSKSKKRALSLLDVLVSIIILGPLAISCWRGVWGCMDHYEKLFPGWFCFTFGTILETIYAVLRHRFHGIYNKKWAKSSWRKRLLYRTLQILYTYTFGVACVSHWRGGWIIIDNYLLMHVWITASLTCLLLICLAILRSIRTLITTPMITQIDRANYIFQFPTRYKMNTRDWLLYLLDCAFSVGVVGTLVVFVWRGVWILIDIYLFPENPEYSAIGSLGIGYFIVAVTFCLQPLMRYICARLRGLIRLIVADAFLLLSFLGTVNVWRGIWNALDLWLLPDNLELSCWITHVGCFILLVLLNCSNTILVRGVYIDAEEEEGQCVVFPCHYLRLFFKIEREKKRARQRKLVASQNFVDRVDVNEKDGENGTLLPNNTTSSIPVNADSLA